MSIASADLHRAISKAWNRGGLDDVFQALWGSGATASEFSSLCDRQAAAGNPFPYCVFEQLPGVTINRMSGGVSALREIRDVLWSFRIHTRDISGDDRAAKEIAADLAEEVMKVFGGHPTVAASHPALYMDHGKHLITQYQNDYGVRTGDDEYQWIVEYLFRLDVPVAV
jgi:hypothetical protein